MSSSNIVEEIKSRCNIVDVVGRVVTLKKAGSNYKGLCPFHNEKTPSFNVNEDKQIFKCFGCGASGDVIAFVEKYYNHDFRGACEMLAGEYGIDLTGAFGSSEQKKELYEINRQAAMFFYKALRSKMNPGYAYMKNRGISEETMNRFGIGYADGQWQSLLSHMESLGISREKLLRLGLISQSRGRYYDKFRDRVIFPIINIGGKVIGFGGRIIGDGNPKYLNSQESDIFQKKNNLYGLNLAKTDITREDRIVLVEGYMDVISLYQSGIRNVCASLGTALTENQARLIRRYTRNVILSYDADEAGQNAAMRGIDILYQEELRPRVLRVTDGKDPDEFVKKNGRSAFAELMDQALPYGDFKMARLSSRYDLKDEQQRLDYLRDIIAQLQSMKPVEADLYIQKIAEQTGISSQAIRREYEAGRQQETGAPPPSAHQQPAEASAISEAEKTLLKLMLTDMKYTDLPEELSGQVFRSEEGTALYQMILGQRQEQGGAAGPAHLQRLREQAGAELADVLEEVSGIVIPPDKEETIYAQCIDYIQKEELRRQDQEITWKLSLDDGSISDEQLAELMQRQAQIQRILKGQGV
ncbi:MAG: DNA primase [Firmicutes bacterium]|nr:DNA primase [Bacillota bacterium]